MKVEWQIEDIRAGRIITTEKINHNHMIGYQVSINDRMSIYGLIDLRDGMFAKIGTKEDVVLTLNKENFFPIELNE